MNEILTINYESENPTVSARELHEKLHIGTKFTTWFERMKEYGFSEGKEFFPKLGETSEQGGRPQTDFEISVDMAKQISEFVLESILFDGRRFLSSAPCYIAVWLSYTAFSAIFAVFSHISGTSKTGSDNILLVSKCIPPLG